ncbi:pyridoxamine 5'-phosphate oxidase [Granulosicoccus antarcticus]|uniref:Pyridoxine/pyridoxamine 5'-phosphate oxidase n=1 Tax=Granulosicoccus antarcticus IMCC3135 TaxID=1192854 RepID=A0A2Z2NQG4_9GAMM|nr:pyridoxamine 5'-phosphate oxidase [Granulosicoccus antarcticus]ASJ72211.1 Pyridoxine/pyridoxamine 5'-phosphate oxidase [Granulosicoccus antarcticus IMCC3135]
MSTEFTKDPGLLIEERRDYTANTLRRKELASDPFTQFTQWLQDARDAKLKDATAMMLSTADAQGQPHSRVVLLKHFDTEGFSWYTFQESDKARQLAANPKASLLFYWSALERQVRIEGTVEKLDPADAEIYFQSRPEGSRFSAAASIQSSPIANREVLEHRVAELHQQHPNGNVPRPDAWGGYRIRPQRLEFWQGRADRLHDRFIYQAGDDHQNWSIQRISP